MHEDLLNSDFSTKILERRRVRYGFSNWS